MREHQKFCFIETSIITGSLVKLGANVKNWKKRYFVAMNQSDNYVLIYFDDETMINEKGRISCCG